MHHRNNHDELLGYQKSVLKTKDFSTQKLALSLLFDSSGFRLSLSQPYRLPCDMNLKYCNNIPESRHSRRRVSDQSRTGRSIKNMLYQAESFAIHIRAIICHK